MRLHKVKSAHSVSYQIIKSAYINKVRTSVVVERLGNEKEICEKYGVTDAEKWAREYVARLNAQADTERIETTVTFDSSKSIDSSRRLYNGGYLFLQDIYHELGIDRICKAVKKRHSFEYNLNSIFSRLVYSRIIYPSSKLSTYEQSSKFIEEPDFELQHIYRALSTIASEQDYIQSALYRNSLKISKRRTGVIYYDCTNFFFETEEEDGFRKYGMSKEHRPNPLVQMGLFMDADGIPLAFDINPGNMNEQLTLQPLEEKLMEDFSMSKFIVCTDAGLSSIDNRKFNDAGGRAFITTQSLKKLKSHLTDWAMDPDGWRLPGDKKEYNINKIDETEHRNSVFYKERWIKENGLEQRLLVSYSIKCRDYERNIRSKQLARAVRLSENPADVDHKRENDAKRFLKQTKVTKDGEIATKSIIEIDYDKVKKEERFDGFYGVCTNLEDDSASIIKVNSWRWQIEECFKIMKSEFRARPVYLSREDRIKAHFMTCFIALIIFRFLERKLDEKYTCEELIDALREYNLLKLEGHGFIPAYTKTVIVDDLHKSFGFDTAKEMIPITAMKKICADTKR